MRNFFPRMRTGNASASDAPGGHGHAGSCRAGRTDRGAHLLSLGRIVGAGVFEHVGLKNPSLGFAKIGSLPQMTVRR